MTISLTNKSPICCANCGGMGHIYKNCNHPVTSYGIICFRLRTNPLTFETYPEYIMVQRKDSLSYVEFIRGKYGLEKKTYIMKLIGNMTNKERYALQTGNFDDLWKNLWQADDCKAYQKEYTEAKYKFNALKNGYILRNENNEIYYFNIDYIVNNTSTTLDEAEWGFPKGRRNINEHDFTCALREFREESGINPKNLRVAKYCKPFEEIFSGTNRVRYKHVYYLASCNYNGGYRVLSGSPVSRLQSREIKDVQWFTYEAAQQKIRDYNVERKELFRRVHQVIMKNIMVNYNNGSQSRTFT